MTLECFMRFAYFANVEILMYLHVFLYVMCREHISSFNHYSDHMQLFLKSFLFHGYLVQATGNSYENTMFVMDSKFQYITNLINTVRSVHGCWLLAKSTHSLKLYSYLLFLLHAAPDVQ